ncbi:MAG: hypothetical protein Fur0023_18030 [Bacteroidia bacterium]
MYIYLNKIEGINYNDLENINLLNHYIGMKKIIPESIPELKIMKPFLWGYFILGLIVFFVNKKTLLITWTAGIILSASIALYDFNLWEIDYGSNLDPKAPIKVEGMNYKPPLIGKKQLLNITATSIPAKGGILFITAILLSVGASVISVKQKNKKILSTIPNRSLKQKKEKLLHALHIISLKNLDKNIPKHLSLIYLMASIGILYACSKKAEPLNYDREECYLCKMLITDRKFGSEILTKKGKIYKFDSIECMIEFLNEFDKNNIDQILTVDYSVPEKLIDAKNALYFHTDEISSPMGANILSFEKRDSLNVYAQKYTGELMNFDECVKFIHQLNEH